MIVVDASVLLAALLSERGAGALARERLRGEGDLHAPHLIGVEMTSALRRRVRLGQTNPDAAWTVLADVATFPLMRWDHEPLLSRVWELRDNLTVYDAMYVVLAELLDARLLTTDARLGRAPGVRCEVEVLAD